MVPVGPFQRAIAAAVLVACLAFGASPKTAVAHAGHDHSEEAVPAAALETHQRVTAQSDDFEIVGFARGRVLTLYLERFSDNEAITDAKIDVEINGETVTAEATKDGTYKLTADWVVTPGTYDLVFTVLTAGQSDLLTGKIEIEPAMASGTGIASRTESLINGGSPISLVIAYLLGMLTVGGATRMAPTARALAARFPGYAARARATARALPNILRGGWGAAQVSAAAAVTREAASLKARAVAFRALFAEKLSMGRAALAGAPDESDASAVPNAGRFAVATPLAVASIGIVVVAALVLLLVGRSVLAQSAAEAPKAEPKPVVSQPSIVDPAGGPRRLLDGTVFVPKASQRLFGLKTAVVESGEVARSMRIAGQVIADPGTSGQVHSSIRGRVVQVGTAWPRVGQKVAAGEVLARVVPVVNPIDRGIIFQQLSQIDTEIVLAQDRVQRLTAADASTKELDEARSDLANLSRRRAAIATVLRDRDTLSTPLLAPADGVIAASFAVAGQMVDEQQKLFEVVDPSRLWVQAYAYDVAAIGDVLGATATTTVGKSYQLKFVSRGPQLQKQTIPLYFQVENPDALLSVGSLVSVVAQTAERRSGLILPRRAIVKDASGQSIVWRHTDAEAFVPMPVRADAIDGDRMLVLAGLSEKMRVVVESANLLSEIR